MNQLLNDTGQELVIEGSALHAYQFENCVPDFVGHLLAFSVGDETLDVDLPVVNPEEPDGSNTIKVCSILTLTRWNNKTGGGLHLTGRVSANNQPKLLRAALQAKQGTSTKFKFIWAKYDEPANNYFKFFHTNDEEIEGEVDKANPIWVAQQPSHDLTQVRNYEFSIGIIGSDKKDQNLHLAPASTDKEVVAYSRERKA